MICHRCQHAYNCSTLRYAFKEEFSIDSCKNFIVAPQYRYKRIADNNELMRLIYDYFTGRIEGHSEDEVKAAITRAMYEL